MKKFLFILILLGLSFTAAAQYANIPAAKRVGCRIKLDGEKLSAAQSQMLMADIGGEDYSAEWANARGWRAAGISMIAGGGVIAAGGAMTALIGVLTSAVGATVGATAGAAVGSIGGQDAAQDAANEGARNGAQAGQPIITGGLIAMGLGLGIHFAGVPITIVNATKMSRLVDKYNESQEPQLSFGISRSGGIGLCLSF
ncbi:MAG: hypothetical protein IJU21_04765 [Bacteroidales bacterium]|nr:hypothetical protein [Bacteroidales bacterium]